MPIASAGAPPRISIITPSFNQARFLERTIRSVLDQGYPDLEFIIVDGGSTDGSVDIIRRYERHLAWWVSRPDGGQACAINEGLRRATGDWVGWQNSDDVYFPGAFADVAAAAASDPGAGLLIGNLLLIDADDRPLRDVRYVTPSHGGLLAEGMVMVNQAAFWRRSLHERIGWLDESLHYCFDYEWFLRVTAACRGVHVNRTWGGFRLHEAAKTHLGPGESAEEFQRILAGRRLPGWQAALYRMRRMALMLGRGDAGYVARGLLRRARREGGNLY